MIAKHLSTNTKTLTLTEFFKMFHFISVACLVLVFGANHSKADCPKPIDTCERGKISFYLYTGLLKPYEELLLTEPTSIQKAGFIKGADTRFLIHGYTGTKDTPDVLVKLRNEFFVKGPTNIVVVDWGPLAIDGCYFDTAFKSISTVGRCCASMLNAILANRSDIKLEQVHVIGFSMGAQVCSRFANFFKPRIIPRVTGLDPAFPKFFWPFCTGDDILNKNHGAFVDVIHTNIGRYGVLFSGAHYDIYANHGVNQPGCNKDTSCNHRRAVVIYTESINGKTKFIARKCEDKTPMITVGKCNGDEKQRLEVGEYCPRPKNEHDEGIYQFDTNEKAPFAKGSIN